MQRTFELPRPAWSAEPNAQGNAYVHPQMEGEQRARWHEAPGGAQRKHGCCECELGSVRLEVDGVRVRALLEAGARRRV